MGPAYLGSTSIFNCMVKFGHMVRPSGQQNSTIRFLFIWPSGNGRRAHSRVNSPQSNLIWQSGRFEPNCLKKDREIFLGKRKLEGKTVKKRMNKIETTCKDQLIAKKYRTGWRFDQFRDKCRLNKSILQLCCVLNNSQLLHKSSFGQRN